MKSKAKTKRNFKKGKCSGISKPFAALRVPKEKPKPYQPKLPKKPTVTVPITAENLMGLYMAKFGS